MVYHNDFNSTTIDVEASLEQFLAIKEAKHDDKKNFTASSKKSAAVISSLVRLFFMMSNEINSSVCSRMETMHDIMASLVGTVQMGARVSRALIFLIV